MQGRRRCRAGAGAGPAQVQGRRRCWAGAGAGPAQVLGRRRCRAGAGAGPAQVQGRRRCRARIDWSHVGRYSSSVGAGLPSAICHLPILLLCAMSDSEVVALRELCAEIGIHRGKRRRPRRPSSSFAVYLTARTRPRVARPACPARRLLAEAPSPGVLASVTPRPQGRRISAPSVLPLGVLRVALVS